MKKKNFSGMFFTGLLLGAITSFGQNTFPASGNVGIGVTPANSALHVKSGPLLMDGQHINIYGAQYGVQFSGVKNDPASANSDKFYLTALGTGLASKLSIFRYNQAANISQGIVEFDGVGNTNFGGYVTLNNGPISVWGSSNGIQFSSIPNNPGLANDDKFYFSPTGTQRGAKLTLWRYNKGKIPSETVNLISFMDDGKVGIGDGIFNPNSPFYNAFNLPNSNTCKLKLLVDGAIGASEVRVSTNAWCDYVFDKNYKLKSLSEVEKFIQINKHLPEVPSEKEVVENGMAVGEMMKIQMKKIEELTLYMIELQKQNEKLATEVASLKK